jgi:hypothetical protein
VGELAGRLSRPASWSMSAVLGRLKSRHLIDNEMHMGVRSSPRYSPSNYPLLVSVLVVCAGMRRNVNAIFHWREG